MENHDLNNNYNSNNNSIINNNDFENNNKNKINNNNKNNNSNNNNNNNVNSIKIKNRYNNNKNKKRKRKIIKLNNNNNNNKYNNKNDNDINIIDNSNKTLKLYSDNNNIIKSIKFFPKPINITLNNYIKIDNIILNHFSFYLILEKIKPLLPADINLYDIPVGFVHFIILKIMFKDIPIKININLLPTPKFLPSPIIDLFWKNLIIDTNLYRKLCYFLGYFIPYGYYNPNYYNESCGDFKKYLELYQLYTNYFELNSDEPGAPKYNITLNQHLIWPTSYSDFIDIQNSINNKSKLNTNQFLSNYYINIKNKLNNNNLIHNYNDKNNNNNQNSNNNEMEYDSSEEEIIKAYDEIFTQAKSSFKEKDQNEFNILYKKRMQIDKLYK